MTERINHPQHYGGDTTYEVIKVIAAWGLGFNLGNVVKYIGRPGKGDYLEDLRKARWYLDHEIATREAEQRRAEIREGRSALAAFRESVRETGGWRAALRWFWVRWR